MTASTTTLMAALLLALFGWLATVHWIKDRRTMSEKTKQLLIIPSWFPWMALALGSVVAQGMLPAQEALQGAMSFSVGMLVFVFSTRRRTSRS